MQEREAAGVLRDTAAIRTPFYVVDETLLKKNLEILKDTAERAGCRILLAQKAFSMYSVYPLIRQYLSGTAASGLYEARKFFWYDLGKCGSHGGRDLCLSGSGVSVIQADRRIPDGGDVCEKYGSQCRTSAFLYGDFVQHLIWLRSGICRSGFLCWNRGSASDPLAVCRYKTAGADSGLFPGRKRVLPVQRLAGADGLCPDGIEHQHGNSCLWCAGRDFCDDAETSKEHLKYRAAEEKIP